MLAPVAGGADAAAVHRRALGVVIALARAGALLAVRVQRAGARAGLACPASPALAVARPRVAQLRVALLALAYLRTHTINRALYSRARCSLAGRTIFHVERAEGSIRMRRVSP